VASLVEFVIDPLGTVGDMDVLSVTAVDVTGL